MGWRWRTAALFCLAFMLGCGTELTELMVVVETDLHVPDELTQVRIAVDASELGGGQAEKTAMLIGEQALDLPITWGLVHRDGPFGPVAVRAEGLLDGQVIVERSARVSFLEGRLVALSLNLRQVCVGVECAEGLTCVLGECVSDEVEHGTLTQWPPSDPCDCTLPNAIAVCSEGGCQIGRCVPGFEDADLQPDNGCEAEVAVMADAGPSCDPRICNCEDSCGTGRAACVCEEGCACELTCMSNCAGRCRGAGTSCVVDAEGILEVERFTCEDESVCEVQAGGTESVRIDCRTNATCDVDVSGATDCRVSCEGGAQCLLRCAVDNPFCSFMSCEGGEVTCTDGLTACNRACP